jgi:o-succinylbenzoate synthase
VSRGIARLELVQIRLPLVEPWVTGAGRIDGRDVLLVHLELGGSEGWGECVAQGEPTYTSEYVEGAQDVLRRHLVPRLVAARPASAVEVAPALAGVKGHPMAKAALEAAVLDAELRARGVNLADHLWASSACTAADPPPRGRRCPDPHVPDDRSPAAALTSRPERVVGGVAVGIAGSVPALVEEVGRRVAEGYRRVKLKVRPGWDVEPLSALREAFGDLALQVDANAAYAGLPAGEARRALADLDRFELLLIEQPLGDDDLVGHAALAEAVATPICLDEAITSLAGVETALALRACDVVNLKAGRVGGYLEAVRIHDRCARSGVPVWCGGMLETGIGRAANLALATLPNFSLPGDLSASDRFWAADIVTEPAVLAPDGTLAVPAGPGTGVELGDLSPWTVARWLVT